MRVCYIIENMFNSGGMERVLSVCASSLSKTFDVSILTIYQKGQAYYFPLSASAHRYDLGLENVSNKRLLKKKLSDFLMYHSFDIVVSLGGIDMYYLHSIKDGSKKIVWFHFAYNVSYTLWHGGHFGLKAKLKGYLQHFKRINHAKQYDQIVVLSSADALAWKRHTDKVSLIFNPVTINNAIVSSCDAKSVISVGRLDYAKGFDYLISAWKLVAQKHPDWSLDIYGDGELRPQLQEQIDQLNLGDKVRLCGRSTDIASCYSQHSIYVMSSRSEALGLVLLEASLCGLPLIAYDCPFGPREVIADGKNGILIKEVGDIEGMANAINSLIKDDSLRDYMGTNARQMVRKFSLTHITEQWIRLFKDVMVYDNQT